MSKKKIPPPGGIVYSTDPAFQINPEREPSVTPAAAVQKLRVSLDKKQRAGKAVTLVTGFEGSEAVAAELGKKLKAFCGTGGSVKDKEILVQGDQRDKVLQWLLSNGYKNAKKI